MNIERSNVHMTSNVYPVQACDDRIDFGSNPNFIAQLADREALRQLVRMQYGSVNDHRLMMQYAESMPGLQDWQARRIGGCDSCSYAEPGDKPWGAQIVSGKYIQICRCEKSECVRFTECRPDRGGTYAKQ